MSTAMFDIECTVYMTRSAYQQKPYRRTLMEVYGAKVHASPSDVTKVGARFLEQDANHPGSLGLAISEAIEDCMSHEDTKYSLGSVLNHVLLHQSVIGQEAVEQMQTFDAVPDYIVGCIGGGSNFAGSRVSVHAAEAEEEERDGVHRGRAQGGPVDDAVGNRYDFADTGEMTPLLKMLHRRPRLPVPPDPWWRAEIPRQGAVDEPADR